ncbi:M56 family metallopeptidase [Streptomyces gamaensis]|uniref:M56 family metallopeptidase n=1 Tax=Streptomyces gamaensis TaxID=1763542 RepID=A0ABW0YS77_9ACTN
MSHLLHFVVLVVCCVAAVRPLARARWAHRMPRTGLALWQAIGLTLELSLAGLLFSAVFAPANQGLAPGLARLLAAPARLTDDPVGTAAAALGVLFVGARLLALALTFTTTLRERRRHRSLLDLVARRDPELPGVALLDHPAAAAYCLPGRHGTIVISTGALHRLDRHHLQAVLAHERAHLRQRHDLVLLPLLAWRRIVPRSTVLDEASASVRLLLEMLADDTCCRTRPRRELADALARFCAGTDQLQGPAGAFGAADIALAERTARLLTPEPQGPPRAGRLTVLGLALVLVATPVSLFLLPVTS